MYIVPTLISVYSPLVDITVLDWITFHRFPRISLINSVIFLLFLFFKLLQNQIINNDKINLIHILLVRLDFGDLEPKSQGVLAFFRCDDVIDGSVSYMHRCIYIDGYMLQYLSRGIAILPVCEIT